MCGRGQKSIRTIIGKKTIAAGMLFVEFCRLATKMKNFQKSENEMLKQKVTSEDSTWHLNCQQALMNILEQWKKYNPDLHGFRES